ncbi:MAG: hypothetical protein LBI60_02385, partial [Bacteroidales bacterium]|nr:hypothetical protein [Bacteroidales bacterium]
QAINGKQAMKIITEPGKDIVTEDIAVEIIKKVANTDKLKTDGIAEITLEPSLLSLFCNELNKKRKDRKEEQITTELLQEFGDNIITEFYENTMSKVSTKTAVYLEDRLLTQKGYRDSVALGDALANGVTGDEIDVLQANRLIRVDEWDGTKRIEFTHDVLCKVAKEKRDKREEEKRLHEEIERSKILEEKLKQNKRKRNYYSLGVVSLLFVIAAGILWYLNAYEFEQVARYRGFFKQNGWFVGKFKLTEEQASHCQTYYRFSKKGSKTKHWTKMQAIDGYHRLTTYHDCSTYLLSQYDDTDTTGNKEMRDKLRKICQWEFMADVTGDFVMEERAYDKDNKFIYSFKKTRLQNEKEVLGSFFDEFGLPVIMRDNDEANYIKITYDNKGNEILHEFYDRYGYQGFNRDGAYKTEKQYNEDGLLILYASLNTVGKRMVDRAGNCGWEIKYDKNELQIWSRSFDDKGNIARTKNGIEHQYEYDKYGNQIKQINLDGYGKPDIDDAGIHIYEQKYNERGQPIKIVLYDTALNICYHNEWEYAIVNSDYDKNGNLLMIAMFDKDEKCTYKRTCEYKNNIIISERMYSLYEDSLMCYYHYRYSDTDNTYMLWKKDEYYKYWKKDANGNLVYDAYFNPEDSLQAINYLGYHSNIYEYNYAPKYITIIEKYFDTEGNLVKPKYDFYAKSVTKVDAINKVKYISYYNANDNWIYSMKQEMDDGFDKILSKLSLGITGKPVRKSLNGMTFYKVIYKSNLNKIDYNYCNEFGEPSLIYNDGNIYHDRNSKDGVVFYYDENGKEITDMDNYIKSLPFIPSCYITDTLACRYSGLEDGDILIAYGDWRFSWQDNEDNADSFSDEEEELHYEKKNVVVARANTDTNGFDIINLTFPQGSRSEIGYDLNKVYYTQKEKERLDKSLKGQEQYDKLLKEDSLFIILNFHITDTAACRYLKEGDILLIFGSLDINWRNNAGSFYAEEKKKQNKEKEITIARANPDTNEFEIRHIILPRGSYKEIGYDVKEVIYTQKERERLDKFLREYIFLSYMYLE